MGLAGTRWHANLKTQKKGGRGGKEGKKTELEQDKMRIIETKNGNRQ